MKFEWSSESYGPATESLLKVSWAVELKLISALSKSSLDTLDCVFRYVPIVMPIHMHGKYTERSRFRKKSRIYDCAPHLDYEIFVGADFEAQLKEYIGGISTSTSHLSKFGASNEQIEEFEKILDAAVAQILMEQADQIKH